MPRPSSYHRAAMNDASELDHFYQEISWNQTFYGVPLQDGGYVWSNCLADVLHYAGRVEGGKVIKDCWGRVRQRMIENLTEENTL